MDLKQTVGLWVNDTASILHDLQTIKDLGFDYIVARVLSRVGDKFVPTQPASMAELITNAAEIGIRTDCWYFAYPDNIQAQIDAVAAALPDSARNLILDVEDPWENRSQGAVLAKDLCSGIASAIQHKADLQLSTFYYTSAHSVPYTAFLAHCESLMPQVYRVPAKNGGLTSVDLTINRTIGDDPTLAKQSLGGLLIATVNRPEMLDAVTAHTSKFQGVNVWLWDGDTGSVITDPGVRGHGAVWKAAIQSYKDSLPK